MKHVTELIVSLTLPTRALIAIHLKWIFLYLSFKRK